LEPEFTQKI